MLPLPLKAPNPPQKKTLRSLEGILTHGNIRSGNGKKDMFATNIENDPRQRRRLQNRLAQRKLRMTDFRSVLLKNLILTCQVLGVKKLAAKSLLPVLPSDCESRVPQSQNEKTHLRNSSGLTGNNLEDPYRERASILPCEEEYSGYGLTLEDPGPESNIDDWLSLSGVESATQLPIFSLHHQCYESSAHLSSSAAMAFASERMMFQDGDNGELTPSQKQSLAEGWQPHGLILNQQDIFQASESIPRVSAVSYMNYCQSLGQSQTSRFESQ